MKNSTRFWTIGVLCLWLGYPTSEGQNSQANLETLKLVQLIFRHGDRVPEYPYPNDPFNDESIWPEGWGQLTNEGKQQEYHLGQNLRTRYGNFLNSSYRPGQIYAVSSETDRTMMSAQLALAGLYPTNNESNWDSTINWQPIPLRILLTKIDNMIRFKQECPKYDKLFDDFIRYSPEMKKLNDDNRAMLDKLSKDSGVNITTINEIDKFYATMMVEEWKGLNIPEWGKALRTDQNFQYLYNMSFKAKTYNNELKRLRTGELTKFLVENVNERVRNDSSKTKMFMISGRDITVIDTLNTFGVLDLQRPPYASVIFMELHQNATGGHFYIELYLRNETNREPYHLQMPDCELQCPLDKFLSYTKPIIPGNWDEECKLMRPEPIEEGTSIFSYVLLGLGIIAVAVFLVGIVLMALQKKKRNAYQRNDYQNF